ITGKERYAVVADEVRQYALGYFGQVPGEIEGNLFDRITRGKQPVTGRTGDYLEPQVAAARRRLGRGCSDEDVLLSLFYNNTEYQALKSAGAIRTGYSLGSSAAAALARGVAERKWIRSFSLTKETSVN